MTYAERLKDPRWQRKRLEVLERDDFQCRMCGDAEKTLNVHHLEYAKQPWDVPSDKLLTLCECCHASAETARKRVVAALTSNRAVGAALSLSFILDANPDGAVEIDKILTLIWLYPRMIPEVLNATLQLRDKWIAIEDEEDAKVEGQHATA